MMSEIADLTYNMVAFTEIMQMVWKRLNDHGKNWRHVYKALVLLEYLIKTGSEKVHFVIIMTKIPRYYLVPCYYEKAIYQNDCLVTLF